VTVSEQQEQQMIVLLSKINDNVSLIVERVVRVETKQDLQAEALRKIEGQDILPRLSVVESKQKTHDTWLRAAFGFIGALSIAVLVAIGTWIINHFKIGASQ
jgi:hypothetical protein